MPQLTGENEKNLDVSGSIRRPGVWKEISFGTTFVTHFREGVNVNLVTINRVSSLHEACLGGHVACAKALLENGAQVNGVTVHGATPLFSACLSGSAACVSLLLEFGAKPQLEVHLASPVHEAAKRGHRECMEILLANDVNINHEVPQLGTPLYVACTHQRVDCVKKLLELGASVDHGRGLDTPLHAAVRRCSVKAVHLLMEYGASLQSRNAQGKSACDLAVPKSHVQQELLLWEGPSALSQLCRLCVRKCLGRACHQSIHKLHLPEPLQRFLLYQ